MVSNARDECSLLFRARQMSTRTRQDTEENKSRRTSRRKCSPNSSKRSKTSSVFWMSSACIFMQIFCQLWVNSKQPEPYMDELYHVPQAKEFCNAVRSRELPSYNTAITTPPAIYSLPALISIAFPSVCATLFLRMFSGISYFICLPLLSRILSILCERNGFCPTGDRMSHASSAEMSLLILVYPPIFFYSLFYYTDVQGILPLLLSFFLALRHHHVAASFCGIWASCYRQTNALLHAFVAFDGFLSAGSQGNTISASLRQIRPHAFSGVLYFMLFRANSYRVVLGDHNHHNFASHSAMLCYFAAYFGLAFLPAFVISIVSRRDSFYGASTFAYRPRRVAAVSAVSFALAALCICITGNYVHPFLLADNRHYVFYVYKRILQRRIVRFALVPFYSVALSLSFLQLESIVSNRRHKDFKYPSSVPLKHWYLMEYARETFLLIVIAICLVPSGPLEPRYFIPGFIFKSALFISRMRLGRIEARWSIVISIAVNVALVFIFCERSFPRPFDSHMPADSSLGRFMP